MRVLIGDDDRLVCDLLAQFVRFCGHEVVATVSGGGLAVIQTFAKLEPDVVLLDVLMPKCNGYTTCHAILSRKPEAKVILISGMVDDRHPFVSTSGATAFIRKPLNIDALREVLDALAPEFDEAKNDSAGDVPMQEKLVA